MTHKTHTKQHSFDLDHRPESYWSGQEHACAPCSGALPDYEGDEVEIARVSWPKSVLGDVVSVRARHDGDRIRYRAFEDNEGLELPANPADSGTPLSLGELTELITGLSFDSDGPSIVHGHWWWNYTEHGDRPGECTDQIALSSSYYPGLAAWYEHEAATWRRERYAEQDEAEAADDSPPRDDTVGVAPHLQRLSFSAAELARERGYEEEPLFTPEGAEAYIRNSHIERAAAAHASLCGQPPPPERYAHLGPLDPDHVDEAYAPESYGDPWPQREALFFELPGVVHAIAEASLTDHLAPLEEHEVEIARVRLGEEPDGVLSLRARPEDGAYRYRLVDEHGSDIRLSFTGSERPLRLHEVCWLLDDAWDAGPEGTDTPETSACGVGVAHSNWAEQRLEGATREEARRYTVISSVYYPMLPRWYDAAIRAWWTAEVPAGADPDVSP